LRIDDMIKLAPEQREEAPAHWFIVLLSSYHLYFQHFLRIRAEKIVSLLQEWRWAILWRKKIKIYENKSGLLSNPSNQWYTPFDRPFHTISFNEVDFGLIPFPFHWIIVECMVGSGLFSSSFFFVSRVYSNLESKPKKCSLWGFSNDIANC
jgi:hypothetical protein